MAFKTLTISDEAHQRLKRHKLPGESFTQIILREPPESLETVGDVLDFLRAEAPLGSTKGPSRRCASEGDAARPADDL